LTNSGIFSHRMGNLYTTFHQPHPNHSSNIYKNNNQNFPLGGGAKDNQTGCFVRKYFINIKILEFLYTISILI